MTPEEALLLAKSVQDVYAAATVRLLETIARATARGLSRPSWATTALLEVTRLRTEALKILGTAETAAARELVDAVEAAYTGGHVFAAGGGGVTRVDQRAVHALAADTVGLFRGTTPRMLRWTEDIYRQVVADTVAPAVAGAVSQRAAAAQALDRLTSAGAGQLVDNGGRRWHLDTYTDMATRTAIGRAHLAGTVDQYRADGRMWVIVSDSPEECPLCRPFEGTVLALDADVAPPAVPGIRYAGTLAGAIAAGLHHPNCTHRIHAYIPGLTRAIEWDRPNRRTDNPDGYRDRQRELERRVRESKRRVAALRPLGDTPSLRAQEALLRRRQAALGQFVTEHDRKAWVSKQRTRVSAYQNPPGGGAPPPASPPNGGNGDDLPLPPPDALPPMGPTLGTPQQQRYAGHGQTMARGTRGRDNADFFHTYVPDHHDRTTALLTYHKWCEEPIKRRAIELEAGVTTMSSDVRLLSDHAHQLLAAQTPSGVNQHRYSLDDMATDVEGAAHRLLARPVKPLDTRYRGLNVVGDVDLADDDDVQRFIATIRTDLRFDSVTSMKWLADGYASRGSGTPVLLKITGSSGREVAPIGRMGSTQESVLTGALVIGRYRVHQDVIYVECTWKP